jgi:integrase
MLKAAEAQVLQRTGAMNRRAQYGKVFNQAPFNAGKTESARRTIPLTRRTEAYLDMRRSAAEGPWVSAAPTKSGHISKLSLTKQYAAECSESGVEPFVLYTFRHTCLTRWAALMNPSTLP